MNDFLPPLVLEMRAKATELFVTLAKADASVGAFAKGTATKMEATQKSFKNAFGSLPMVTTVAFAAAAAGAVKLASDFQTATTQLVTGAGESAANLEKVKQGLLDMAPAVGMGPTALAKGMFLVESAGYHGAQGLLVMKAAAEGAKVGGADAATVANALTTALTDFHQPAKDAATVTSELVATVASGKTNMTDLAGALSAVAPTAAAAHISLSQMLGAMGTMTGEGISAQQSAQDLASSIRSLSSPTAVQTKEMAQMGLNSIDVAKNLGKNGLTGTFDTLAQAVLKHMGPSGLVLQSAFNQSKVAAASARQELAKLPAGLQGLGKEFLNNQITQKEWSKILKGQPILTANLGKEFAATAKQANGFSGMLRAGGGSAETFNGAMAKMTGGAAGLSTSLALTGANMSTFKGNVKTIGAASTEAGGHVKGWGETQKDFAVQMDQARAAVEVMGLKIGTALMPVIAAVVKIGGEWTKTLIANKPALYTVVGIIGAFAATMIAAYAAEKLMALGAGIAKVATFLLGDSENAGMISTVAHTTVMVAQKIAIGASAVAMGIVTAAQWLWNAAMDANPIGLIIIAVGALVAAIIWVATKTTWFQDAWKATSKFLVDSWKNVSKWFADIWNGIVGFFQGAMKFVVDLFMHWTIYGLIISNWSKIVSFFGTVWSDIVNGVSGAIKNVGNFFLSLPGVVWKALSGAATWLVDTGKNMIQGLLNGAGTLLKNIGNFFLSILPSWIVGPFKTALGIHSPSKVFHGFGLAVTQGLINGLEGGASQVKLSSAKLSDYVISAFKLGKISGSTENSLLHKISADNKQLSALAAERAALATKIGAAQTALANAVSTRDNFASGVTQGILGQADVTSGSPTSSNDMISKLQSRIADTKKFASDLSILRSQGLDNVTYGQLVAAFQQNGDVSYADQLVAGGPGAVSQIAQLQSSLGAQAAALGTQAGSALYGAGVDTATGLLNGLNSQQAAVTQAAQNLANSIVGTVKKTLGIHSPSKVFHEQVGRMIGLGTAQGIDASAVHVHAAARRMVAVPPIGHMSAPSTTFGAGTSSSSSVLHGSSSTSLTINAQTNASPRQIAASVGWELRRRA